MASSLVKGVYTLERDRQNKRVGPESRAKPWWDFLHFTLLETLIDKKSSIYGAVFEYELYNLHQDTPHLKAPPRYVIAFRGTILEPETLLSDGKHNLRCFFNRLHRGNRFILAEQAIHTMVVKHSKPATIWLTGHSLGAALALLAGKTMITKFNFFLEAHIFNPPILSFPLEQLLGNNMLKGVIRITENVIKATVATVFKDLQVYKIIFMRNGDVCSCSR